MASVGKHTKIVHLRIKAGRKVRGRSRRGKALGKYSKVFSVISIYFFLPSEYCLLSGYNRFSFYRAFIDGLLRLKGVCLLFLAGNKKNTIEVKLEIDMTHHIAIKKH